uniref:Reverse transcriptase domain-containing protein n=1 Tax=Octopus bimaculoides TaxID=37653 RepID=A0A0L8GQW2_OCTBM
MVQALYNAFGYTVVDDGDSTGWFKVTTGVKQGCVMPGFLFFLAIGWVMQRTTEKHKNDIKWNLESTLEDFDFADNLALLSSTYEHIQSKTYRQAQNSIQKKLGKPKNVDGFWRLFRMSLMADTSNCFQVIVDDILF